MNKRIRTHLCPALIVVSIACAMVGCSPLPDVQATGFPTPSLPLFSIDEVYQAISSPDYLLDCKDVYPETFSGQASYRGIIPGVSTKQDVTNLLGSPMSTQQGMIDSWAYENGRLGIVFRDSVVDFIAMSELTDDYFPMEHYLTNYGCPAIVIAYDPDEHPNGQYSRVIFAFPGAGLEIEYDSFPVDSSKKPRKWEIRRRETTIEYLMRNQSFVGRGKAKLVLSWADVMGKQILR